MLFVIATISHDKEETTCRTTKVEAGRVELRKEIRKQDRAWRCEVGDDIRFMIGRRDADETNSKHAKTSKPKLQTQIMAVKVAIHGNILTKDKVTYVKNRSGMFQISINKCFMLSCGECLCC